MMSQAFVSRRFIGRSHELAFVRERTTTLSRSGFAIAVRGEAGLGKSRLLAEIARAAAEIGVRYVSGTTRPYANEPYAAFLDAFRRLGLSAPLLPETSDDARATWFASVAEALRHEVAAHGATIVALEDIHWADPATISLVQLCAERLRDAALGIIVTYRTEDLVDDPARASALGALERIADVVTINPLAPGQIEHLIRSLLEDHDRSMPAESIAAVRDLADGRPLFAEELARSVLERAQRDDTPMPAVPTSVRSAVRERFAMLAPIEREIVSLAAVVGRSFSARLLQQLTTHDTESVLRALQHARDLQLVVEGGDVDGDRFDFRHALTREAIYTDMLRAQVRRLHARVADELEREALPNVAAIAEHTWRAGDQERALAWNRRAGDEAFAFFSYSQAILAYDRVYQATTDPATRRFAAERVADAFHALTDLEGAAEWFGRASFASHAVGDETGWLRFALRRARCFASLGRPDDAVREVEKLEIPDGLPALAFERDTMLGGFLVVHGRAREGLSVLQRAERLQIVPDPTIASRFYGAYAVALALHGRTREARECFVSALACATDDDVVLRTLMNRAFIEMNYGTIEQAEAIYGQATALPAMQTHLRHRLAISRHGALIALLAGDLDLAEQRIAEAAAPAHDDANIRYYAAAIRLRIHTLRGNDDTDAADEVRRALQSSLQRNIYTEAILAGALSLHEIAFARDDEARRVLRETSHVVDGTEAPFWLLRAVATHGDPDLRRVGERRAASLAEGEDAWPARGVHAIFLALEARRRRRRADADAHAADAADAFMRAGWRLPAASALELCGRTAEALAAYQESGARGEVLRLSSPANPRWRRGEGGLSKREREIAGLLVAGRTARAIADSLVISERTVETHVASIYRKLGCQNRRDLVAALSHPEGQPAGS